MANSVPFSKSKFLKFLTMPAFIFLLIISPVSIVAAEDAIRVGDFSSSAPGSLLPEKWEPLTFEKIYRQTQYIVVEDANTAVIKAASDHSASGLIRKIRIDPEQYPIIKWRWKITNIYKNGDVTKKNGDDYPARIYITFAYEPEKASIFERIKFLTAQLIFGNDTPYDAISYIWESKAPVGTLVANPYTDYLQMFVIQSGSEKLNIWIDEERNLYQDYIRAFGKKPPVISGIAIMTDSDDTGEKAVSYYGDIVMESGQ